MEKAGSILALGWLIHYVGPQALTVGETLGRALNCCSLSVSVSKMGITVMSAPLGGFIQPLLVDGKLSIIVGLRIHSSGGIRGTVAACRG